MSRLWTLGILAGGESRRMGSAKAELQIAGQSMLQRIVKRLAGGDETPILIGTRPEGPGARDAFACVSDLIPGAGPLSSLAAILAACTTPYLLCVPCDMPFLPADLAARMLAGLGSEKSLLFSVLGRVQPFPMLLQRSCRPALVEALESGERRALGWMRQVAPQVLDWSEVYPDIPAEDALTNVNDAASLASARARAEAEDRVAGGGG